MKKGILIALCVFALKASASHIVGGEFELIYLSPNQYRLSLIYYFDVINNGFNGVPPQQQEPTITAAIFRKIDNAFIRNVVLTYSSTTRVSYTQPSCSKGEIVTDKLIYTTTITLSDAQFGSPEGYYVVWERCCRNYTITNILSDPPAGTNSANTAGQTFYLEFPPVVKDGQPFINSSPKLFPPLNDYACPNRPYYADFAGTDDDGDSLIYTLTVPLSTHQTVAVPPLLPAPFPLVKWRSPYDFNNVVGGHPDLKVSDAGFLTVTPTTTGLFVFAVKCEEFRKGVKLGEVRRDFQMLVVDCPAAEAPKIVGKKLSDAGFIEDNLSVTFSNEVSDENRCVEVRVSDADASKADQNFSENITLRAIPLNFKKDISGILPVPSSVTLTNGSTKTFRICFDRCPPFEGGPFQVGIIAYDDACSLPLSDTLRVTVNLEPPDNTNPFFTTPNFAKVVNEGEKVLIPIEGVDLDDDPLVVGVITDGFQLDKVGMRFINIEQKNGLYRTTLEWDSRCNMYDFTKKTNFTVRIFIEDQDDCLYTHPAIMTINLGIILPGNNDPLISTDLPPDALTNGITREIYDKIEFNVFGKDKDKDLLLLRGNGIGYSLTKYGITFPRVAGIPVPDQIQSKFVWDLACEKFNLKEKSDFDLRFVVVDSTNKCRFYKSDTLLVKVKVLPPTNHKPVLSITNVNNDLNFVNNEQSIVLGQQISLALNSIDEDKAPLDNITIDLIDAEGNVAPEGYLFEPASGAGSAQTTFSWLPTCSIFQNGVYENNYTFKFRTADNRCVSMKADTVEMKINIKDVEAGDLEFLPPNIITPNGDPFNEFFAMVREDPETGQLLSILPPDNCVGTFVGINIYNRWGKEVFESESRDFKWYPKNEAAGVYFYTLKYSNREYKGNITLRN